MKKEHQTSLDSVFNRITAFNAGRDPERLALKYKAIADNPFSFYRGTCHLFYQDLPADSFLDDAPAAWICGDLHLENFGSYKGDNRLVYFDINDFDEAILAPAHWELSRFLVSVRVAARSLGVDRKQAAILCERFLDAYVAALLTGKARWIERATAEGMVRDLLRGLRKRSRVALLDSRTDLQSGRRRLRIDGKKALPVDPADRQRVVDLMAEFARTQPNPEFFKVRDVARRIAGTGSLGIERYVILVRGRGGSEGAFLLDLKIEPGSALAPYVRLPQPDWRNEAERVVALQRRVQAVSPAFLTAVNLGERAFVLRELLPSEDRVALNDWNGELARLEGVMRSMGDVVAWAHLRAGGRQGSATADAWLAFAEGAAQWRRPLLNYAETYARQVIKDWRAFAAEYRKQNEK